MGKLSDLELEIQYIREDLNSLTEKVNKMIEGLDVVTELNKSYVKLFEDMQEVKNVLYNNTEEALHQVIYRFNLNTNCPPDSGIIRYFQSKVNDVIKQYKIIKNSLPSIDVISVYERLTDENFIKMFTGGGSSELRAYYSYEYNGVMHYYPSEFLNEIDLINAKYYTKFVELFKDYLSLQGDKQYALKKAVIAAFTGDVTEIYTKYIDTKYLIKDPYLLRQEKVAQTQMYSIDTWKEMIADGDYQIKAVLKAIRLFPLNEQLDDMVILLSNQWNEVIKQEINGVPNKVEKDRIKSNILNFLNLLEDA